MVVKAVQETASMELLKRRCGLIARFEERRGSEYLKERKRRKESDNTKRQ